MKNNLFFIALFVSLCLLWLVSYYGSDENHKRIYYENSISGEKSFVMINGVYRCFKEHSRKDRQH